MLIDELLTGSDVAEILRVPSSRVARLAKRGEIPHVILPDGEVRFVPSDLQMWIAQRRFEVEGGSDAT